MRYLGGEYIGEHRPMKDIRKTLAFYSILKDVGDVLLQLLEEGVPRRIEADLTRNNFLSFRDYGNHPTVTEHLSQVMKTMNKEERNSYLLPFPEWMWRFVPNLHLRPHALVVQPEKKDRLIFDGSFLPDLMSTALNDITHKKHEPPIRYATCIQRHIARIWNLRISYPSTDILLMDDDISAAFRQMKHHVDVIMAFAFVVGGYLFFPTGGTFGSNTSPSNFESIANARTALMEAMQVKHTDLSQFVDKHWDAYLRHVQFSDLPSVDQVYSHATADCIHEGVFDTAGNPLPTPCNMFVGWFWH